MVEGHSLTLRYKDGQKQTLVSAGITIIAYHPGSIGELKLGAAVFIPGASSRPDGTLEADDHRQKA